MRQTEPTLAFLRIWRYHARFSQFTTYGMGFGVLRNILRISMRDEYAGPVALRQMQPRGRAYVVPCGSAFRDRVMSIAGDRGVSVGDLVRSVLLLLPSQELGSILDPGKPMPDDREAVKVLSGPSKGRGLRRKPRLQVRLIAGYGVSDLRRTLALAMDLTEGVRTLLLEPEGSRSSHADPARVVGVCL